MAMQFQMTLAKLKVSSMVIAPGRFKKLKYLRMYPAQNLASHAAAAAAVSLSSRLPSFLAAAPLAANLLQLQLPRTMASLLSM